MSTGEHRGRAGELLAETTLHRCPATCSLVGVIHYVIKQHFMSAYNELSFRNVKIRENAG